MTWQQVIRKLAGCCVIGLGLLSIIATSGNENDQGTDEASRPYIRITSPSDGSTYAEKSYVSFSGTLYDTTRTPVTDAAYVWTSDIDGQIGTGASPEAINTLSKGTHTITLTATDGNGAAYSQTCTLIIAGDSGTSDDNEVAPTATIVSPADGARFTEGDSISFTGSAVDEGEDGLLTGSALVWYSSKEGGSIGTGTSIVLENPVSGTHVITLIATDSGGATGSAEISIVVGNNPPTATISFPADGSTYAAGESVVLTGSGYDAEDGAIPGDTDGTRLSWSSSVDGFLGSGSGVTIPVSSLSRGNHVITLTAIDSEGATGTTSVGVTVSNTIPTVTIDYPLTGATFDFGDTVTFNGQGTDTEDGDLTDRQLVWRSDLDGVIGTGASVQVQTLSRGTHEITLTGTDSDDASATASVSITMGNTPPTATITYPAEGTTYAVTDDYFIFNGIGNDAEDGPIPDNPNTRLEWYCSAGGLFNPGPENTNHTGTHGVLLREDLTPVPGATVTYTITLVATDSNGDTGTDAITILVPFPK
ncbi:MAG: hypothetical protein CSA22_09040 [Deltaproteobacteria bacterium]|nr:MAG: hypothetical protein CSA22_09040 [Deltaproteobacteria bacterium]